MARNVLIVDDSSVIRQMVRRLLDVAGLNVDAVFEAGNGIEALAALHDHEISVMLVDINMPCMNGLQLVERIKSNPKLHDIPLVIVSTEGSEQRISELKRMGISAYIRKPFTPEQLRDVLTPILGVSEHATADAQPADDSVF